MKVYAVLGYDEFTRERWVVSVFKHKTDADKYVGVNEGKEPGETYYVEEMHLLDNYDDFSGFEGAKC